MKTCALFFLALAAVIFGDALGQIRFRSCGRSRVTNVVIDGSNGRTPDLYRGRTYTLKADYIAGTSSSSLKTIYYAIMSGAHLEWEGIKLKDGCASVRGGCPISKGRKYTYVEQIVVPDDAPQMRTVTMVKQFDGSGAEHLCFLFSVRIK